LNYREELLKKMPLHSGKVPSLGTLIRMLEKVNQDELCNCFNEWMSQCGVLLHPKNKPAGTLGILRNIGFN